MISKNSINRAILVGHIGQDPDIKYTTSGHAVATFSLATNEVSIDIEKNKTPLGAGWQRLTERSRFLKIRHFKNWLLPDFL